MLEQWADSETGQSSNHLLLKMKLAMIIVQQKSGHFPTVLKKKAISLLTSGKTLSQCNHLRKKLRQVGAIRRNCLVRPVYVNFLLVALDHSMLYDKDYQQ